MCGIAGIFSVRLCKDPQAAAARLGAMAAALRHRGPDAQGIWLGSDASIGLCHRRLSVMDLSDAGSQPMTSACGRFVMVFNGEIYNHLSIRSALEACDTPAVWRGESDTETLMAAIRQWGLKESLRRSMGMFALALWDKVTDTLHLGRDRMGEKPLYLAKLEDGWAFGSELKALLALDAFKAKLDHDAIASYLAYSYVPDDQCIFKDVQKIQPGTVTRLSLSAEPPESEPFEVFDTIVTRGLTARSAAKPHTQPGLEATLKQVVGEQMLSDVPLGCFLSGGIDSSLIAALMQDQSDRPIHTFSISFQEARFNEAHHAARVAAHLGTDHAEFLLSEQDALGTVTDLARIYDEPFGDPSQIPTVLLSRMARKHVTVALTGDGGDEVFGGYNRHIIGPRLLSRIQRFPPRSRRLAGRFIAVCAPAMIREGGWMRGLLAAVHLPPTTLDKVATLGPQLGRIDTIADLYDHFARSVALPEDLLRSGTTVSKLDRPFEVRGAEWMMAMDSATYLPGDILVKVDRAAMAASLETRAPFLDPRVVAAGWALPLEMKISDGKGKQALRSILYQYVPRLLIERPKQGFAVPLDQWLRGELREWGEVLISQQDLMDLVGIKSETVNELWVRHQDGTRNHGAELWNILMLLDWIRYYRGFIE